MVKSARRQLIEEPIKQELRTLEQLDIRYAITLSSLDTKINDSENEFEKLLNELVVTFDE